MPFPLRGSDRPPLTVAATSISRRATARPGGWQWPPCGASKGGCKSSSRAGGVAEQQLDGAQIGAGFEQMCGEAMSKSVRMQRLVDPGAFGGFPTGVPDNLVADGVIGGVPAAAREQPNGRFAGQAAIMCAQFIVQMGAEHDVAVLAALALLDMHHHAGS